ncbi:MAG TPA: glycosyl hydrolase [Opitutaceae bacterium]|nr:glycosyl hydrolase [Opitutaceae bacterium]
MNSPRFLRSAAPLLALIAGLGASPYASADLTSGFAQPPASAAPRTWWHWISGNVSREGITADLEAMKAIGLGGAQMFTVDQSDVKGPVVFMSPQWRDLVRDAIKESDRLGLELSIEDGEGWSESGGPWVTPARSMQKVVWAEAYVRGGARIPLSIPQPLTIRGYYEDIAVFAFPTLRGDGSLAGAKITTSAGPAAGLPVTVPTPDPAHPQWVQVEFPRARPVSSFRFSTPEPLRDNPAQQWELQASDDGLNFRHVCNVNTHLAATFPEVSARFFRLWLPVLPPRATALTFSELNFGGYRLPKLEAQSGIAVDRDINRFFAADLAAGRTIVPRTIVDLTGKSEWNAPAGEWTLLRIGHTSTGITNHPASPATVGLECDKLSAVAVAADLNGGSVGAVISDSKAEMGKGLQYLLCDSWEAGCENWTPLLREEFKRRWGYELEPWLPVLTGRVVGDAEQSQRFLWDFRRLLADLVAVNHYGTMQQIAHQNHLGLYAEAPGINLPTVADELQCKGRTDIPMGEFWVGQDWAGRTPYDDAKETASAAHIYGQNIAAAEAFTARPEFGSWAEDPYSLKALGDLEFCLGINRFVFHRYAHQPWLDRQPGMSMGPWGTNFERTNTWWNDAAAWMAYLSRCQFLLQQGHFAADACYYYGEGAPIDTKVDEIRVPAGYDYDVCNTEILLRMRVQDGRIKLPSGMSYRVLILPDTDRMTAAVARKIRELVRAGATVMGRRPRLSPSLSDLGAGDNQVQAVAAEVWGDCDGATVREHRFGAGRIVWNEDFAKAVGAPADFSSPDGSLHFIHRDADGTQIYFVSNQSSRDVVVPCTFRDGRYPELWHPDTGKMETPALYHNGTDGCTLPLHLDPSGSVFVVFPKKDYAVAPDQIVSMRIAGEDLALGTDESDVRAAQLPVGLAHRTILEWKPAAFDFTTRTGKRLHAAPVALPAPLTVAGDWVVSFPPKLGAPAQVTLPRLESWTDNILDGVKFFSGTATYAKEIDIPAEFFGPNLRQFLDLGAVKNLARVRINGRDLGVLWKEPFRTEITGAARPGKNRLEIEVTNLWPNRMIGDSYLPAAQRITWASVQPYKPGSPLLPSGLLGPVVVRSAAEVECRASED